MTEASAYGWWGLVIVNSAVFIPVLVRMYVRSAGDEKRVVSAEFGAAYQQHAARVPRYAPQLWRFRATAKP